MGKSEKLIIPTPAGPREVYCDKEFHDGPDMVPVDCIGCEGAFILNGCGGIECLPRQERLYQYGSRRSDTCGHSLWVFVAPDGGDDG